ncbi:MAG: class I SAM-dependent methyltransferase [Bacteroidales bacterium]|jgi:SAM-dependent methyltransferase|nr:class I SAM-dependent methyltransferase [Bacteroidales bacterium]
MKKIIKFFLRNVPRAALQRVVRLAIVFIKPFYWGNKVECSVCGKHYRKFLPYGYVHSRPNALCPNCLSLERHRLLWLYFNKKTDILTSSLSFLHIAPEICFVSRLKSTNLDYKTADLESPWADLHFNIENIPLADESFDVVMANHILEHVEDLDKALNEIYRVLKTGGRAILLSPVNPNREVTYEDKTITDPLAREKAFGQKDHLREFGKDYAQVIGKDNVVVIEDKDFIHGFTNQQIYRYGLGEGNENIYLAIKK